MSTEVQIEQLLASPQSYAEHSPALFDNLQRDPARNQTLKDYLLFIKTFIAISSSFKPRTVALIFLKDLLLHFTSADMFKLIEVNILKRTVDTCIDYSKRSVNSASVMSAERQAYEQYVRICLQSIYYWAKATEKGSKFGIALETLKSLQVKFPTEFKYYPKNAVEAIASSQPVITQLSEVKLERAVTSMAKNLGWSANRQPREQVDGLQQNNYRHRHSNSVIQTNQINKSRVAARASASRLEQSIVAESMKQSGMKQSKKYRPAQQTDSRVKIDQLSEQKIVSIPSRSGQSGLNLLEEMDRLDDLTYYIKQQYKQCQRKPDYKVNLPEMIGLINNFVMENNQPQRLELLTSHKKGAQHVRAQLSALNNRAQDFLTRIRKQKPDINTDNKKLAALLQQVFFNQVESRVQETKPRNLDTNKDQARNLAPEADAMVAPLQVIRSQPSNKNLPPYSNQRPNNGAVSNGQGLVRRNTITTQQTMIHKNGASPDQLNQSITTQTPEYVQFKKFDIFLILQKIHLRIENEQKNLGLLGGYQFSKPALNNIRDSESNNNNNRQILIQSQQFDQNEVLSNFNTNLGGYAQPPQQQAPNPQLTNLMAMLMAQSPAKMQMPTYAASSRSANINLINHRNNILEQSGGFGHNSRVQQKRDTSRDRRG